MLPEKTSYLGKKKTEVGIGLSTHNMQKEDSEIAFINFWEKRTATQEFYPNED